MRFTVSFRNQLNGKRGRKKVQTIKVFTVYLLLVWTITWLVSLNSALVDTTLLQYVMTYVQQSLVIIIPYTFVSATDRWVYATQAKYGGKANGREDSSNCG